MLRLRLNNTLKDDTIQPVRRGRQPTVDHPQGDIVIINMNYTYLIKSVNKKWYYIGSTKDLNHRFNNHNNKKVKSTKGYAPFELIYYESYKTYSLARTREIELKKNGQQKEILFRRLGIS